MGHLPIFGGHFSSHSLKNTRGLIHHFISLFSGHKIIPHFSGLTKVRYKFYKIHRRRGRHVAYHSFKNMTIIVSPQRGPFGAIFGGQFRIRSLKKRTSFVRLNLIIYQLNRKGFLCQWIAPKKNHATFSNVIMRRQQFSHSLKNNILIVRLLNSLFSGFYKYAKSTEKGETRAESFT